MNATRKFLTSTANVAIRAERKTFDGRGLIEDTRYRKGTGTDPLINVARNAARQYHAAKLALKMANAAFRKAHPIDKARADLVFSMADEAFWNAEKAMIATVLAIHGEIDARLYDDNCGDCTGPPCAWTHAGVIYSVAPDADGDGMELTVTKLNPATF